MKRFAFAAVLATLAAAAAAQTTTTYVFTTVDAVKMDQTTRMSITGIQEGATAPSTVVLTASSYPDQIQNCQRLALLAMTKPGQYLFKVVPASSFSVAQCALERVAP